MASAEVSPDVRPTSPIAARVRRVMRLVGPAFVVSIGYMDPGNWATDLAGGAYGGRLFGVVVLAGLLAIVLQILAVRLGAATGDDLATHISKRWPRAARPLWGVAFGSAIATDLAEFTGVTIGFHLLFGIALPISAAISAVLLAGFFIVVGKRVRRIELALIGAVGAISVGYLIEVVLTHPDWGAFARQAVAPLPLGREAIVIAVGIVGATVMPHNLFLHSALIARRARSSSDTARMSRTFVIETIVALMAATLVNGAILVVGAHLHAPDGSIDAAFAELMRDTSRFAALLFGAALVISGFASATSATLAGDYIFRGFAIVTMPTNARRAATLAPALLAVLSGADPNRLLLFSQVALALALPIVLVPLVSFTGSRAIMGRFASGRSLRIAAYAAAGICVMFDIGLLATMRA